MSFNCFVALGTVSGTNNNVFTESTATGYARQGFQFGLPSGGRCQGVGAPLTFTATSAVLSYNALAFFTAVSGGNPLLNYYTGSIMVYGLNTPFVLSPYSVVLDIVDGTSPTGLDLDNGGMNLIAGTQPYIQLSSSTTGIAAFATGGQTNATLLTSTVNRVTTVTSANDSIKLPPNVPGFQVTVINSGTNPCQVFGSGTDQINNVASATGVSQQPNSLVIYTAAAAGLWFSEGLSTGFSGGLQTQSFASGLTATGSTQGGALLLPALVNRVTTAAASTGVLLPVSAAGLVVTVINRGANNLKIYGSGTDVINSIATATGTTQQPNSITVYTCTVAGNWETDGVGQGFSGSFPTVSYTNAITATASGTQGTSILLTTVINRITTVVTAADSVLLPLSQPGMQLTVSNAAAANSMNVFPGVGDQINTLGANAAFAIAANKTASFSSAVAGQWHAIATA